ncbi:peroxisomal assembly protein [Dinochytrium kinnereticum]|nr:peroxisomal assembly protein [Dinochytrium kinnereticum]
MVAVRWDFRLIPGVVRIDPVEWDKLVKHASRSREYSGKSTSDGVWVKSTINDGLFFKAEKGEEDGFLVISSQVMADLGLSPDAEYDGSVELFAAVSLDEVLLEIDTSMSPEHMMDDFNASKLAGEFVRSSSVVHFVSQDYPMLAKVLSCSPVLQGMVTETTKIIVAKSAQPSLPVGEPDIDEVSALEKLVFSQSFWGDINGSDMYFSLPAEVAEMGSLVKFTSDVFELKSTQGLAVRDIDLDHSVIMLYADMAANGFFEGQQGSLNKCVGNVYGVKSLDFLRDCRDKRGVLCGPALFFNLGCFAQSSPTICIQSLPEKPPVPLATELTLSVISTPISEARHFLDLGYQVYMLQPVDLANQIASNVRLKENMEEDALFDSQLPSQSLEYIYFKVEDMSPSSGNGICLIDPTRTKVEQKGLGQSRIPCSLDYDPSRVLYRTSLMEELSRILVSSFHPLAYSLSLNVSVLLHGASGSGKRRTAQAVADNLHLNCYDIVEETPTKIKAELRKHFDRAVRYSPCLLYLRNVDAFGKKENGSNALSEFMDQQAAGQSRYPVITIASATDLDRIPDDVLSIFRYTFKCEVPSEADRSGLLLELSRSYNFSPEVSLRDIALQTAGFTYKELASILSIGANAAVERVLSKLKNVDEEDLMQAGLLISQVDLDEAISSLRAAQKESLGAPKIPKVSWDDIGGLDHVKEAVVDTIQLPLERPELFSSGAKKRSGLLFYGPPGTGKTLVAKAVASSFSLNFLSVKGPELLNMYIGESEANVRKVFERARDARPCVVFFDELDSVAPKRGEKGDSGGVMDRIVSQLLAELDGVSGGSGGEVFVIGATNRPDLLDPALLRPGRFDKLLYLGVSDDHEKQENVLRALTRKFPLEPSLSLKEVARKCPLTLTGADMYALCSDAMLKAINRTIAQVEKALADYNQHRDSEPLGAAYYLEAVATKDEKAVLVKMEDFAKAIEELKPSVSAADLMHYHTVQEKFK